ncbi:hypothetical protein KI387_044564, partial [Taxus chinensis]
KIVLRSEINCEKCKRKVLKAIAEIHGVDSVSIDLKAQKIIVIGDADPVVLTRKLRKSGFTELVSVGTYKEEKSKNSDEIKEVVYIHDYHPYSYRPDRGE